MAKPDQALERRRLPRVEREAKMLDAAEAAFGASGFAGASMDAIAAASGITKALLYQYFGSKQGLYEACIERARRAMFDDLTARVQATHNDPTAQLHAFVDGYFAYLDVHRERWWTLYGDASGPAINDMRERNAEAIAALVAMTAREGGRELEPISLQVVGHALVGCGEQVGRWWLEHPDTPRAEVVDRFLAVAQGAIAAVQRRDDTGRRDAPPSG
jgi:AcrR family transcriptional regulator